MGMDAVALSALSRRVASQPSITGSDKSIRMISGALSIGALERLDAVARLHDVEPRKLEVLGVHFARIGVVVDDEHARTIVLPVISAP